MTDIVTNYWSMGVDNGDSGTVINHGFRAADGWFVMQVARQHMFERLADVVGPPEWLSDPRFDSPYGVVGFFVKANISVGSCHLLILLGDHEIEHGGRQRIVRCPCQSPG